MLKENDVVFLKKDLMFKLSPLSIPPILHKNFKAKTKGRVVLAANNVVYHVEVHFEYEGNWSISFYGKDQIEEYLERVE